MKKRFYLLFALLLLTFLSACGGPPSRSVNVTNAWLRPTSEGMAISGAYLTIQNNGNVDELLIEVSSEIAGAVEIHETQVINDIASMVPHEDGLLILAGQSIEFRPGGLHLMLLNLNTALELGETVEFTLRFESGLIVQVEAQVAEQAPE